MTPEALLTKQQVADLFTVTTRTIDNWTRADVGFPQPLVIGSTVRWKRDDIHTFIDRATAKAATPNVGQRKSAEELLA